MSIREMPPLQLTGAVITGAANVSLDKALYKSFQAVSWAVSKMLLEECVVWEMSETLEESRT